METAGPASVRARILVVGDESGVAGEVTRRLAEAGYSVDVTSRGSAVEPGSPSAYDLVVLEVAEPPAGIRLLDRLLRVRPQRRVVVVSAAADPGLAAECLNRGAEDYLSHPFSAEELLARVWARLRGARPHLRTIEAGGITLDLAGRLADAGSGPAALAGREFLLLSELVQHRGRVVSKTHLRAAVWGRAGGAPASNVVDVYVRRLRAKLGSGSIKTVRGRGYMVEG